MKVLKIILAALVVLAVVVVVGLAALPDEVHLSREIVIDATPHEVYREISSFRNFNHWSPWAALDSATVYTYDGPAVGVGARMSWSSEHEQVGEGSQEIIEAVPGTLVKNVMKFGGFDSSPTASFILTPVGAGTQVTWTYDELGVSGMMKVFGLMMDGFLGPFYERGLQALKARLEAAPEGTELVSITAVDALDYIGIASTTDFEIISTVMAQSYGQLMSYVGVQGVEVVGNPIAITTKWDAEAVRAVSFICALPVKGDTPELPEGIERGSIPGTLVAKGLLEGDYSGLPDLYTQVGSYVAYAGFEVAGYPWEEYLTDPTEDVDTAGWQTVVYYPVK